MPNVAVSRNRISSSAGQRRLRRQHAQQHAGPVLLHVDRRAEHVQRAGGQQLIVAIADHLGRHVVEVGFQHPDLVRSAAASADRADEQPQHVGLLRQSRAGRRRGRCAPPSWPAARPTRWTTVVRMAAPVGVVSSALIERRRQRHALEQLGRAGRGNRHQAVGALDHAAAGRHGAAGEALDAEQVQADGGRRRCRRCCRGRRLRGNGPFPAACRGRPPRPRPAGERSAGPGRAAAASGGRAAGSPRRRGRKRWSCSSGASMRTWVAAKPPLRTLSTSSRIGRPSEARPSRMAVGVHAGVDQGGQGHVAADAAETVEMRHFHG